MKKHEKKLPLLFVLPAVAYLTIIGIFPLLFAVVLSFLDYNMKRPELGMPFVGLQNYMNAFDPNFRLVGVSFDSTLPRIAVFTVSAITIEFILGLALAYVMRKENRVFNAIRPLILIPMIVSPVAVALMARFLFHQNFGLINQILGTTGYAWYADPAMAMPVVILLDIWEWTPFMFLLMVAGISSIPKEITEASLIDGVSGLQQVRHIVLPIIRPILAVAIFFRLLDALKVFEVPWILTRGGPAAALEFPNVHIYRLGFRGFYVSYASALSIIVLLMSLAIVLVMIKLFRPIKSAFGE
jgi:multiple sugar transport system permease protein